MGLTLRNVSWQQLQIQICSTVFSMTGLMSNNYGSSGNLHETKDGFKHTKLHASNCHKMKTDWIHALYRAYKAVKHPEIIFMFI